MMFSITETAHGPLIFLPFRLKNEVTNTAEQLPLSPLPCSALLRESSCPLRGVCEMRPAASSEDAWSLHKKQSKLQRGNLRSNRVVIIYSNKPEAQHSVILYLGAKYVQLLDAQGRVCTETFLLCYLLLVNVCALQLLVTIHWSVLKDQP